MRMPTYPEYKDSGVSWFGQIPVGWNLWPLKRGHEVRLGKMLQTTPSSDQKRCPVVVNVLDLLLEPCL